MQTAGQGDITMGQRGPMAKKAGAPIHAGYRQVIELMREGFGPEEILTRLRMRPSRLRQIAASRYLGRMVELEGMTIESTVALRLGDKVGETTKRDSLQNDRLGVSFAAPGGPRGADTHQFWAAIVRFCTLLYGPG